MPENKDEGKGQEFTEKRVDESWKNTVESEKTRTDKENEGKSAAEGQSRKPINIDFNMFITSMGMQAMIHLGLIENPVTKKKETDLATAKETIDILSMLKEKTKGNLSDDEDKLLTSLVSDLQLRFVEASK